MHRACGNINYSAVATLQGKLDPLAVVHLRLCRVRTVRQARVALVRQGRLAVTPPPATRAQHCNTHGRLRDPLARHRETRNGGVTDGTARRRRRCTVSAEDMPALQQLYGVCPGVIAHLALHVLRHVYGGAGALVHSEMDKRGFRERARKVK